MIIKNVKVLKGEVSVPGDKSISHRAVMFGSIAKGKTEIKNFLQGADCLSTIHVFRQMGIEITNQKEKGIVTVKGNGLRGLVKPTNMLDVGNSGTTMRLISGILSGQAFDSSLTGDSSIVKRPMGRIITPLSLMGANIKSIHDNGCAPLQINSNPNGLTGITYTLPVASAQIKSSVLLAGLYANGETTVIEPSPSRDHTEIMLGMLGANIESQMNRITIKPNPTLTGERIIVPGDISSAAYFIVAALIVPNSEVLIKNVGINPTRDGILRVLKNMRADITIQNIRNVDTEPVADLLVKYSNLVATVIEGDLIPTLIDEIPIIAILACYAKGETIIKDASELKVKESNRIDVMVNNLSSMGANIVATEDGMIIKGECPLKGTIIDSKLDHRIAMSFAVAGLVSEGEVEIIGADCVTISYPNFYEDLESLSNK